MSTFDFNMSILSVDEKTRSYEVAFYTPALLADFEQNELPLRVENLMASDASLTREDAEERARATWSPGERRRITIYDQDPPPAGQALLEYLSRHVPVAILQHRERCLQSPSVCDASVVGYETVASIDISEPIAADTPVTTTIMPVSGA